MNKVLILTGMALLFACNQQKINYPETRKVDTVDNYHGTLVADPYRWLEDDRSPETEAWVKEQNKVTFSYLEKIPCRDRIRERITDVLNYPRSTTPEKKGDYYFIEKNSGLQDQDVIWFSKDLGGEFEIFLDPNTMSDEGTAAITAIIVSDDNEYAAYSVARSGSDWQEIFVRDMESGEDLNDHVQWTKFGSAAWYKDGFFYSSFEEPDEGGELSGKNLNNKVFYHKLGNSQDDDKQVYFNPVRNDLTYIPIKPRNSKYLLLYTFESTHGNALYIAELGKKNLTFSEILPGFDYQFNPVGIIGDLLFVQTDKEAGKFKISVMDLKDPDAGLRDIIPEMEDRVISNSGIAGGKLVVQFEKDAQDLLSIFSPQGKKLRDIELPGPGSIGTLNGQKDDKLLFYSFQSFTSPPMDFKYHLETGEQDLFYRSPVDFDDSEYFTEQVFFESKDGTRIPMFIVRHKDTELDGNNPLWLYGYGGFNNSLKPRFSASRIVWLENGGIYVSVNLRGGSEYGEEWHKAGSVMNKQNVFDDFIAAAEYLIENKYTSSEKMVASGASNGGLLVGAVINQRPDLFKVAFPAVGVMDMLRFHKFTIGYYWVSDYGSSDDPEQFEYIYRYSPLHNIRPGVRYPAVMIETADHDDRVVPAHSFKYAATLQEHYQSPNPVLIRIDTDAGHGGGKPISKIIDELADVYSFAFHNLDVEPKY